LSRSSTAFAFLTAPWNLPIALIIFGWRAQTCSGSIPLPCAGSRPVSFVMPLRMNR
jgi:hypothetical protein